MTPRLLFTRAGQWRVEPGAVDPEPLLLPAKPWDLGTVGAGGAGTVLFDPQDRLYKCWYVASPAVSDAPYSPASSPDDGRVLAYATSSDGKAWVRPELSLFPYGNHSRTNIVLALEESQRGSGKVQYASVNLNLEPGTPPSRRFEMYVVMTGDAVVHMFSADGLSWVRAPKLQWPPRGGSDSIYVYKGLLPDENYTAFIKTEIAGPPGWLAAYDVGAGSARVISKTTSADGTHWERAEIAITPDWRDTGGDEFVELTATSARAMGGSPLLLGTTTMIHTVRDQTIDLQFAASRDGLAWWRPGDRRSCVPCGPAAAFRLGVLASSDCVHRCC